MDQACEARSYASELHDQLTAVGCGEHLRGAVVVPPVGVDRAEHGDVLEHHVGGQGWSLCCTPIRAASMPGQENK